MCRKYLMKHGELVACEQLNQECAAHRRNGQTDTQKTGDQAALTDGDLIRHHRHHDGEQRVEKQLGDAPSDEHDRNGGCQRDDEDTERPTHQADDHPRPRLARVGALGRSNTGNS